MIDLEDFSWSFFLSIHLRLESSLSGIWSSAWFMDPRINHDSLRCRDGEIFSGDTAPARMLHPLNAVVNAVKARTRTRKGKSRAIFRSRRKIWFPFCYIGRSSKRDLSRPKYCVTTHYLTLTRADRGGGGTV